MLFMLKLLGYVIGTALIALLVLWGVLLLALTGGREDLE